MNEGRKKRVAKFLGNFTTRCAITYGTTGEDLSSRVSHWTVKHRISVARQSFPGPRECTPRNRAAVVRTLSQEAFPRSVHVAASCSFSALCSEVSLREFWI